MQDVLLLKNKTDYRLSWGKIVSFLLASQWGWALINAFPDASPLLKQLGNVGGPVSNVLPFLLPFLIVFNLGSLVAKVSLLSFQTLLGTDNLN